MRLVTDSGEILNLLGDIRISIRDIGKALSRINRYTGHSRAYTVAQHSVLVSELCPPQYALQGLLHDAHEAITGDVSSPVKEVLGHMGPQWADFEAAVASKVRAFYLLPKTLHESVKAADRKAVDYEIASVFDERGRKAWRQLGYRPDFSRPVKPVNEEEAFAQFMCAYKRLGQGVGS